MRRFGPALRAALTVLLLAHTAAAQQRSEQRGAFSSSEQTRFNADDSVRRPVEVPAVVLRQLARDRRVRECMRELDARLGGLASWFVASAIDLNRDGRTDHVVLPRQSCLFGANIIPFWVFRSSRLGHELVLKTHALQLDILRTRTGGHRDIEISASFMFNVYEATYRFERRRYLPRRCSWQSIEEAQKGRRGKIHRFKCGDPEKPY